ncbi:Ankyrin repeats (3 copies) [Legionella moravica]|nr:Ankyrin repeats (3 copies) [Legionella moravica]
MPEDNKNAWVNALHFHRQCLHNHDLSLTPLLDDTVMLEERLRAFERGFAMWRNGAYHDFISNYAANWFAASDNDRITDCASLFARLCDLYFRENTEGSNSIPAIRVPDAMLDEWIAKAGEDGILEVTPYQINRVLLHALCYPADTWSTLFQQCLPILLAFIRNRCNQKQNTAGDALSRDSWPEALLAQIECVAVAYSIGEILDPVLLTPGTITPESSLDIARLLAVSKDMPEAIVRKIVELPGFDPNATNRNRLTPFYLAAEYGNTGFAAALMGRGANYKVRYLWDNVTPLQVAIKNQHLPFLQWFLQALPEHERELLVAAIDYNGTTLLNHAAHNSASLKIILDCLPEAAREDIVMRTKFQGDTMLHEVARNNPKFLKDLLNYLPEAARTNAVKLKGIRDITILHLIAGTHLELLKEILDCLPEADRAGAVRECYSLCGSTLLHFAASKSTEILKQLLDFLPKSDRAKAVMNQNKNGNTVVHLAVGYPESLKQLLNFLPGTAVADTVKLKNIYEKNVLDLAVAYPESLEWLLNSLPETVVEDAMRAQNTNGNTVLCRAVAHLESLKLLLNYLPKKKVEDAVLAQYDYGKTVLHQAVAYPESFQLLLDYLPKATVAEAMKLKNRDGNTVLHLAARDPELLKMLLNYRPKATVAEVMTLKNLDGHTVLHVAAINSPDVLIQLLDYLPETVRAGAIVAQINGGYNLLHLVAEKRPDVLIQLLDYLPDPARASAIVAQNRIGETVLHLVSGYPESLRYLKAILEQAAQQKATQSDVGPIIPNQDAGAAQSSIASSSETGTSTLLGSHSLFSQGSVRPQDPDSPGEQSTLKR